MKRLRVAAALAAGLIATPAAIAPAIAQEYPQGPVTMVVAFSAGGPSDTVARVVGERMSRSLGQPVLVENVAGAGGTLGAARAAKAEPDGQTLLLHHVSLATAPSLYPELPYDTATAFAPIGLVSDVPMVVLGRADLPPTSLPELLDYIKEEADTLTAGTAGNGSGAHLCAELLSRALGLTITTASYKGTGPAMIDLLGGQIDMMCDQTTTAIGQIRGGKIKAYAVTGLQRSKALPELPTLAEAGLSDVELSIWHGLYAPVGTPEPVVDRLAEALREALQDPAVVARFDELATEPASPDEATPTALRARLDAEITRWRTVLATAR